jgi:hypothetical protein
MTSTPHAADDDDDNDNDNGDDTGGGVSSEQQQQYQYRIPPHSRGGRGGDNTHNVVHAHEETVGYFLLQAKPILLDASAAAVRTSAASASASASASAVSSASESIWNKRMMVAKVGTFVGSSNTHEHEQEHEDEEDTVAGQRACARLAVPITPRTRKCLHPHPHPHPPEFESPESECHAIASLVVIKNKKKQSNDNNDNDNDNNDNEFEIEIETDLFDGMLSSVHCQNHSSSCTCVSRASTGGEKNGCDSRTAASTSTSTSTSTPSTARQDRADVAGVVENKGQHHHDHVDDHVPVPSRKRRLRVFDDTIRVSASAAADAHENKICCDDVHHQKGSSLLLEPQRRGRLGHSIGKKCNSKSESSSQMRSTGTLDPDQKQDAHDATHNDSQVEEEEQDNTSMEHEHETTPTLSSSSSNSNSNNSNSNNNNTAEQQQNNHPPNVNSSLIRRRSDISLLLGALLQSQALRHIQMESVELILHQGDDITPPPAAAAPAPADDDGRGPQEDKHEKNEHENSSRLLLVHASLLVTVSIPYLEQGGPFFSSSSSSKAAIMAGKGGRTQRVTKTTTTKFAAVPSVTRMLYTLIQSNWHKLETCDLPKLLTLSMTSTSRTRTRTTATAAIHNHHADSCLLLPGDDEEQPPQPQRPADDDRFFPTSFRLGSIYHRLQDIHTETSLTASNRVTDDGFGHVPAEQDTISDEPTNSNISMSMFPSELLVRIGAFLRAKSLHAFRCTSKVMYTSLLAVVPGMKLHLFPHQCRSLEWMRTRESDVSSLAWRRKQVKDGGGCGGVSRETASLLTRATAGIMTSLAYRHTQYDPSRGAGGGGTQRQRQHTLFTLHTGTGHVAPLTPASMEAQGWIARGGLLCDDPGLGKTITVLSLLLQTMGQSTEPDKTNVKQPEVVDHKKEFTDKVFQCHWESLLPQDRKRELLEVWSIQKKLDHYGFFDYPVTVNVSGKDGDDGDDDDPDPYLKGYLDVVKQPISMAEIKDKIVNFAYGAESGGGGGGGIPTNEFDAFCRDILLMYRYVVMYVCVWRFLYI